MYRTSKAEPGRKSAELLAALSGMGFRVHSLGTGYLSLTGSDFASHVSPSFIACTMVCGIEYDLIYYLIVFSPPGLQVLQGQAWCFSHPWL